MKKEQLEQFKQRVKEHEEKTNKKYPHPSLQESKPKEKTKDKTKKKAKRKFDADLKSSKEKCDFGGSKKEDGGVIKNDVDTGLQSDGNAEI